VSFLNCSCPLGMYGVVTGPTTADCKTCPVGQFCPAFPSTCSC
jgi:hypothetical protein